MNCQEANRLMIDIDQLSQAQQADLERHAQTCAACAEALSSLRSISQVAGPLASIDIAPEEGRFVDDVMSAIQETKRSRRRWLDTGSVIPWLAAASLFLASLFVYEQFGVGPSPSGEPVKGTILNASVYRQELNKIRERQTYRANLLCRSPYRKPEQAAACVRQKYVKTASL